ncbi:uncharacterized protein LOC116350360 [Contarinia nasturtii]|uniref:uncharacterized protein LOC116350360 n=1 Tax=Contarinia nasturtii TaxID=265458 RepID=UPI0012D42410|nr:uncharacterized protein LOC116350360 [Contarinia nasturtii]
MKSAKILFVVALVMLVRGNPDDPLCLTSVSQRVPVVPEIPINIESKGYHIWMYKCCGHKRYDPKCSGKPENDLPSIDELDTIVVKIGTLLTNVFDRAAFTDAEFSKEFNSIASQLRGLLKLVPDMKESVEGICYDLYGNMLRIKPNLKNSGYLNYFKKVGLGTLGAYLSKQKYKNAPIQTSSSEFIHIPMVKASLREVKLAIKAINKTEWLKSCTVQQRTDEYPDGEPTVDIPDDLESIGGTVSEISKEFEEAAKQKSYTNFSADKSKFDSIAKKLSEIYRNNGVDVKFNVDRVCRDMFNILTFMRACDRPESNRHRK